jgi:uncharacterized protein YyaL (SSP411 family)
MRPNEKNPQFRNALVHSTSPYLKQHANNPVFWYPWGEEAIGRARRENKPILLSIGYSTCYWCHVMEREVFMNPSIAAQMNEKFINIKVDREELPQLDEIYMVARQLMTKEGGWPNNVFLTPDLKPFFAGGTFPPADMPGRSGFPRLLEWLNHAWTTQPDEIKKTSEEIAQAMTHYLHYAPGKDAVDMPQLAEKLFATLKKYHDESAGGFFQAPKFPHENYLGFLTAYYEYSQDKQALDILTLSLRKMAAGGIYDHVGCGFHRYAVDKEWYVPHFEKMLYNQSQLARVYTDAARLTGNPWFADIARSILEFVLGPMTDGSGGFYAALDAETDGVEGAYYAWTSQEFEALLKPEEANFLVTFYALADIPKFPGHKHTEGQALILRQPLDLAAQEKNMPYLQLSAMCGYVMNKLLTSRNTRQAPGLDNKIVVSWNGLMIDALAYAAKVFDKPRYAIAARRAVDFLLEHAIDNDGKLCRVVTDGKAQIAATLEDYAALIKGLLTLYNVLPDQPLIDAAVSLTARAEELFFDAAEGGYFFTEASSDLLVRIKSADDGALPNANALMLHNLLALHGITKDDAYEIRAIKLRDYFLSDSNRMLVEVAALMQAALQLEKSAPILGYKAGRDDIGSEVKDDAVAVTAKISAADVNTYEVVVTLDIKDGWHINANEVAHPMLVATQVDVQGQGVESLSVTYPPPSRPEQLNYAGLVHIKAQFKISKQNNVRPPLKVRVRYQPCNENSCHPVQDVVITL